MLVLLADIKIKSKDFGFVLDSMISTLVFC